MKGGRICKAVSENESLSDWADAAGRWRLLLIGIFHAHFGRGADETANEALDLLARLGVDFFNRFFGERALAGFLVDLFAGQTLIVFAGDFAETHAGDVDGLFDGVAA